MRNVIVLISAFVFLFPQLASAQSVGSSQVKKLLTAETMMELCEGSVPNEPVNLQSMTCSFRIQGVVSMMIMNCLLSGEDFLPNPRLSASPPVSNKAIQQTFLNFMKERPELWSEHWATVLAVSISDTFPCEDA